MERNPKDEMCTFNLVKTFAAIVKPQLRTVEVQTDLIWISEKSQMIKDTKFSNSTKK